MFSSVSADIQKAINLNLLPAIWDARPWESAVCSSRIFIPAVTADSYCNQSSLLMSVPQSCPAPWDPGFCSPPGSSVHGILQARTLEWVAMPSSRGSSWPRDGTQVSHIAGGFFTLWATKPLYSKGDPKFHTIWSLCQLTIIVLKKKTTSKFIKLNEISVKYNRGNTD